MQIEHYFRKMGNEGYWVLGATDEIGWEPGETRMESCKELKISLDEGTQSCDTWEKVISKMDMEQYGYCLEDIRDAEHKREFKEYLPEILKGESDVFRVVGFNMSRGLLEIIITEKDGCDRLSLIFDEPKWLTLKFTGTKTKLGFTPTYRVIFRAHPKSSRNTIIEEDSGYRKRLINFLTGELEIMEYTDI